MNASSGVWQDYDLGSPSTASVFNITECELGNLAVIKGTGVPFGFSLAFRDDQQDERQMNLAKLAAGWKGPH